MTGATVLLTGIGPFTGTLSVEETFTAGALTPGGTTAAYQWQASDTAEAGFTNLPGTSNQTTYAIQASELGKYLRVQAVGTGSTSGTVHSASQGPVLPAPLQSIGNLIGIARVDETLTAGAVIPAGATVEYFWQNSDDAVVGFSDIPMAADSETYKIDATDVGKHIRVEVVGTGGYSGTVSSQSIGPVVAAPLQSIGAITGLQKVGETLTAGTLVPVNTTTEYQWQVADTVDEPFVDINDADATVYVVDINDQLKFIRVEASGVDDYAGVVVSDPVEIGYSIGSTGPGGGIVFFDKGVSDTTTGTWSTVSGWNPHGIDASESWRYLEVATASWDGATEPEAKWDPRDSASVTGLGLTNNSPTGLGKENTETIVEAFGDAGYAAKLCDAYTGGGYTDWFLPTVGDLQILWKNLKDDYFDDAGFTFSKSYYTSCEVGSQQAWLVWFGDGSQIYTGWYKWNEFYVRPVRRF